jgi:hypothetical protein
MKILQISPTFLVAPIVIAAPLAAIAEQPPTSATLAEISARGRLLAGYDRAAWHATDAVLALHPDNSLVGNYIAKQEATGKWRVVFGKRSPTEDSFLISYEAVQLDSPSAFAASARVPPIADTAWFLKASRTVDTVRAAFRPEPQRPYNIAVLPSPSGDWFVYVYPAVTTAGVWPLGGDTRYTVSADGQTILSTRQLHRAILERTLQNESDSKVVAAFHTHALACIPEDTDVFVVLSRQPQVREYIVCEPFMYVVEIDGAIQFLGLTKDILGERTKK